MMIPRITRNVNARIRHDGPLNPLMRSASRVRTCPWPGASPTRPVAPRTSAGSPVARNRPRTRPSGAIPVRSNRKMSCIVMTSPSIPVISETAVTLRVPSAHASDLHDHLDRRGDLPSDRLFRNVEILAIATIVSRRYSASRGLLAWIVVKLPSWPVFIACSMSSASSLRTSPTTMRSGLIRRALTTSSRCRTAPLPSILAGRVSSRTTCRCRSFNSRGVLDPSRRARCR